MRRFSGYMLAVMLVVSATSLFAENRWSYTLGFTGTDLVAPGESPEVSYLQHNIGVDFRGSAILKPVGFYYATYINVSFPMILERYDYYSETVSRYDPNQDLIAFAGVPFGFRGSIRKGKTSFFTGIGPAVMVAADYDSHLWISGMLVTEIGMEFVRTKGVGLGFSCRATIGIDSILVNLQESTIDDIEYTSAVSPKTVSLILGISWTSVRD